MTRNISITVVMLIGTLLTLGQAVAQETRSVDSERKKIEGLALKWYGAGAKVKEVESWQAIRITARGYDKDGERRWLVLFPEAPIGKYNAYVVPMAVDSERNISTTMSVEARTSLLSVSNLTVVCGVSIEKRLNDLVLPYLLRTGREKSKEWTQGTYYYFPLETVREYKLDLKAKDPNANAIPLAASLYIDENGFLIHRKITGVLTISRSRPPTEKGK